MRYHEAMRRAREWLGAGLLLGGLIGCDRLLPGNEVAPGSTEERGAAQCRQECGATYKECLKSCEQDSPQACESRCDRTQQRCNERCSKP